MSYKKRLDWISIFHPLELSGDVRLSFLSHSYVSLLSRWADPPPTVLYNPACPWAASFCWMNHFLFIRSLAPNYCFVPFLFPPTDENIHTLLSNPVWERLLSNSAWPDRPHISDSSMQERKCPYSRYSKYANAWSQLNVSEFISLWCES